MNAALSFVLFVLIMVAAYWIGYYGYVRGWWAQDRCPACGRSRCSGCGR